MLKFTSPYTGHKMDAAITRNLYVDGERLYVGMYTFDPEDGFWEMWCDITVNLPDEPVTDENCGYVDVNNAPYLPRFLEDNGLAEWTGKYGYSGFCQYPEFRFNIDRLDEHLIALPF